MRGVGAGPVLDRADTVSLGSLEIQVRIPGCHWEHTVEVQHRVQIVLCQSNDETRTSSRSFGSERMVQ